MKVSIYSISYPETGNIFYVGQTVDLKKRANYHRSFQNNEGLWKIFSSLNRLGLSPVFEELDYIELDERESRVKANELERYWIEQVMQWGFKIENIQCNKNKSKNRPNKNGRAGYVPINPDEILFIRLNLPRGISRVISNNLNVSHKSVVENMFCLQSTYNEAIITEARRLLKETAGLVYNSEVAA